MLAGLQQAIRLRSIGRLLLEETDCHILSSLRGEYSRGILSSISLCNVYRDILLLIVSGVFMFSQRDFISSFRKVTSASSCSCFRFKAVFSSVILAYFFCNVC